MQSCPPLMPDEAMYLFFSFSEMCECVMQSRHPLMPDEAMAELAKQHLKGALPDDIWKEVVQGFCKIKVGTAAHPKLKLLLTAGLV